MNSLQLESAAEALCMQALQPDGHEQRTRN